MVDHAKLLPPDESGGARRDAAGSGRGVGREVEPSEDAIQAEDLNGIITSWSPGAERLFGYSAAEVVGRPASLLMPPESDPCDGPLIARARQGQPPQVGEGIRVARDGRRLRVSLVVSPVRDDGGRVVGVSTVARELNEHGRSGSHWQLLARLGESLAPVLDEEELLRTLATLLVGELADYCVTYLLEGDRIRRVGAAHADPDREALVRELMRMPPPVLTDQHGAGAVIRTGEPTLTSEVPAQLLVRSASSDEHLRILRRLAPLSSVVLPLRARGRTVGAVALVTTSRSGRRYGPEDVVIGRELADRAALALDNARLLSEARAELRRREAAEEALRARYEQLQVMYQMTEAVGRAGAVEEVYEQALSGLQRVLGADRASVLLFDPDGVMRFKAWSGLSDGYRRAVEGHTPWAPDTLDPLPIVIPDVAADQGMEPELRATILGEGIHAMAFVPLVFGGRLLGKFMLYFDAPRALQAEELELAHTIAVTIAFAITRMQDERSIREVGEKAERASQAKSQFLGIMSHELRTPLNAVLGYAELLLLETKGRLTAEQRRQVERIQVSARHQLGLVEELLTYTRLEAGREEPRLMEIDARRVLADVLELVLPEADGKGVTVRMDVPDAPLPVRTDPAKLRQIVLNLAANATKYTDRGEVVIRGRSEGPQLLVEVQDTGPGIPADKLGYIFEPFTRVDESRTRLTAGTGLGLAIVRQLATLLGGEVTVRSRPGHGSTFSLRLPATQTAPPSPATGRR